MATCRVCHGSVGVQDNGELMPHQRYADGAGPGPDQSHELVPCEGGAEPVQETKKICAAPQFYTTGGVYRSWSCGLPPDGHWNHESTSEYVQRPGQEIGMYHMHLTPHRWYGPPYNMPDGSIHPHWQQRRQAQQ